MYNKKRVIICIVHVYLCFRSEVRLSRGHTHPHTIYNIKAQFNNISEGCFVCSVICV